MLSLVSSTLFGRPLVFAATVVTDVVVKDVVVLDVVMLASVVPESANVACISVGSAVVVSTFAVSVTGTMLNPSTLAALVEADHNTAPSSTRCLT